MCRCGHDVSWLARTLRAHNDPQPASGPKPTSQPHIKLVAKKGVDAPSFANALEAHRSKLVGWMGNQRIVLAPRIWFRARSESRAQENEEREAAVVARLGSCYGARS